MGRFSGNGSIIMQLRIRHEFIDSDGTAMRYEPETANLLFREDTMSDRFIFDKSGEEVGEYMTYFNSYRTAGYQWVEDARAYIRLGK